MLQYLLNQLFGFESIESKGELLMNRIIEGIVGAFALLYIWQWAGYIAKLFDVVLPLGLANYLDVSVLFNDTGPYGVAVLATLFVLLGFLKKWKYAYLFAFLCFHVQYVARFSQGKTGHGSNLVGLCLLALALGTIFFKQRIIRERFAKGLMLFFAGWGYFTAACCKLIATGIFWVDGRHLWLWLGEKSTDVLSQTGMFQYNFLQQAILEKYWLATIILIFGITTELLSPLLWFQKTRAWMGLLLVGLHIGILHSMNISFDKYVYIIILLAFPWDRWLNKWFFTKS